ncbi:MAG: hypothetical protein GF364_19775 [Candidatus Lokiarchaeota archaeon]|nr:hypothetical protein [Candidatus Lokiarchaeota archaeon]
MSEEYSVSIRFHARGGQGGVTASQLCVDAFDGYGVNQPRFGAERMGSPTESYARLSKNKTLIRSNEQVYSPNYVGVLDDSLLDDIDVTTGIKPGGWLIVNTTMSFEEIEKKVKATAEIVHEDINYAKVDATGLALEILKRNITNTVILGALVKVSHVFSLDQLKDAIYKTFKESIAEPNAKVVELAFERTELLDRGYEMDFKKDAKVAWSHTSPNKLGYEERDPAGIWYTTGGSESVKTGSWGVSIAQWDEEKCINCHKCWSICPDLAIKRELGDDGEYHVCGVDDYHCKGCMQCVKICPKNALTEKVKRTEGGTS